MKNYMWLVIIGLPLITALVVGCQKPNYNDITFEESLWMIYDEGQRVIYENETDSTDLDTLVFFGKAKSYFQEGNTYDEFIQIQMSFLSDSINLLRTGLLRLLKSDEGFRVWTEFPHHPEPKYVNELIPQPVVTINNQPFANVYTIEANPFLLNNKARIKRFYYSKEFGFLKYTDINDNSWEILLNP